jgi:hypothetical protein
LQAVGERMTPLYGGSDLVRPARMRAGDRDRDAVAARLREHHLAGRLDGEEFQDRLGRCLAAKTYGELDALVADLPVEAPAATSSAPAWGRFVPVLVALVVLAAVIVVSHGRALWLAVPGFFFLRAMLWRRRSRWGGWRQGGAGAPPSRRSLTTY